MWRDALLVAGKDLRIEGRSRVALNQVLPFAILVLVLFAFALDPDRGVLVRAAAGLYWVAVLFSALLAVQRLVLELRLGVGVAGLYSVELRGLGLLAVTALVATAGLAAAGTLYGVIAAGLRVRETLLPLLLLPVLAPVLIAATRASETALSGVPAGVPAGSWLALLATFAVVYVGFGVVAFGPLLEDA